MEIFCQTIGHEVKNSLSRWNPEQLESREMIEILKKPINLSSKQLISCKNHTLKKIETSPQLPIFEKFDFKLTEKSSLLQPSRKNFHFPKIRKSKTVKALKVSLISPKKAINMRKVILEPFLYDSNQNSIRSYPISRMSPVFLS